MWTETAIEVGACRVRLSVRLLDPEERERVAASAAWLCSVEPAGGQGPASSQAWATFVEDVLGRHVTFTIDDTNVDELGTTWWGDALRQATAVFIRLNALQAPIEKFLTTLKSSSGDQPFAS